MARKVVKKKPAPPTSLAFQDDAELLYGPRQGELLDRIKAAGGKDVRANVVWGRVRKNGGYDLTAYDNLVNAARQRGLNVQMTLMGTPRFSKTDPNADQSLSFENNDPRLWKQFAGDMAKHFRGRVGRYSIGNEPNHDAFQAGASSDPRQAGRDYRNIYRAGYAGVKGADRGAQVLLGEITSSTGAQEFLRSVLAGKPIKTAGLAYHPYDLGGKGWNINNLQDLQATLGRYKRQGRLQTAAGKQAPLYLTEFGYQQGHGGMNDAQRAQAAARGYRLAQQAGARQFLQYQVTPKTPMVRDPDRVTPGGVDPYTGVQQAGQVTPGGVRPAGGWVWDTSLDPGALALSIRGAPRARVARKAVKRR